jgi:hypothetical protein
MTMRPYCVLLHRYAGLAMALFLTVAGLTGGVITFYAELEVALNPHLYTVTPRGEALSALALRARAAQHVPQARFNYVDLHRAPEQAAVFYVQPRIDPSTDKPYTLTFNQLFVDPCHGFAHDRVGDLNGSTPDWDTRCTLCSSPGGSVVTSVYQSRKTSNRHDGTAASASVHNSRRACSTTSLRAGWI